MKWIKYLFSALVVILVLSFTVCLYSELNEQCKRMAENIAAQSVIIDRQNQEIEVLKEELHRVETETVIYEKVASNVISRQW